MECDPAHLAPGQPASLDPVSQYATRVIGFSSEWTDTEWSAARRARGPGRGRLCRRPPRLGAPHPGRRGDFLTVGFDTPVYADGVTVWETFGNGFVTGVDVVDTDGVYHTVWTGADPSPPGVPSALRLDWAATSYLVAGVKIYVGSGNGLAGDRRRPVSTAGTTRSCPSPRAPGRRSASRRTPRAFTR